MANQIDLSSFSSTALLLQNTFLPFRLGCKHFDLVSMLSYHDNDCVLRLCSVFYITELKGSSFKAWSRSVHSHTCYAYCQEFLPCYFLLFQPIHRHFISKKPLPSYSVLAVANNGSCVGPHNNIGHPVHYCRQLMQVPVLSARGI